MTCKFVISISWLGRCLHFLLFISISLLIPITFRFHNIVHLKVTKAALRRSFYACVYCMWLRFQRNYVGWLTACIKRKLKTTVATQLYSCLLPKFSLNVLFTNWYYILSNNLQNLLWFVILVLLYCNEGNC